MTDEPHKQAPLSDGAQARVAALADFVQLRALSEVINSDDGHEAAPLLAVARRLGQLIALMWPDPTLPLEYFVKFFCDGAGELALLPPEDRSRAQDEMLHRMNQMLARAAGGTHLGLGAPPAPDAAGRIIVPAMPRSNRKN